MADGDDSLEQLECDLLEERGGTRVAILRAIRKLLDKLEDRKKARLQAIMRVWCEGGKLTPEMMNTNEGRTKKHKVMLQAFKTFKVRLYGFDATVGTKRTFVIVDGDPAKKQNKADKKILDRAKSRIDELVDRMDKKGTDNGAN